MSLTDDARYFAVGDDEYYTGQEVRFWVYRLCDEIERLRAEDGFMSEAYAEGQRDQRAADAKALDFLAAKMRLGLA